MDDAGIQALLATIPLPALQISGDWRLEQMNGEAVRLFGASGLGRHFNLTIRQPQLVEAIEAACGGAPVQMLRVALTIAGHETVFNTTVGPMPGGGAAVTLLDVTDQELVTQFRRDFVANVSHELRTPLTALLGFIETLQGPARDDPVARERFLTIMAREAGRMTRLVRDLLSLSRVEAQERQRPSALVDLTGVIGMVVTTLRPMATEAGVRIDVVGGDQPVFLPGDSDQLMQVFHNLVENAVKYGGSGKSVTITLRQLGSAAGLRGPVASVAVQDQGEGIDAVHLPRLTERFYRVDAHRSREKGGTGLGLAIVKHILRRHRGRLQIDSIQGQGSTFTALLPLQ